MLNQLPEIAAPHPPHILSTFEPLLQQYEPLDFGQNFYRLLEDICQWVRWNPIPWPVPKLKAESLLPYCSEKSLFHAFVALYNHLAQHSHATNWCCKSMSNVHRTKEIAHRLPKAKFIHLVRDGRDVACSLQRTPVGPKHLYVIANHWLKAHQEALEAEDYLGPTRYFRLFYKDLVHAPEKSLKELCSFLGLPFQKKMLQYHTSDASHIAAQAGEMWARVSQPLKTDHIGHYKDQFTEEQLQLFERIAGPMLNRLGFETGYTSWEALPAIPSYQIRFFERIDQDLRLQKRLKTSPMDMKRRKAQEAWLATRQNPGESQ